MNFKFLKVIISTSVFGLTSCLHTTYVAKFEIKPTTNHIQTKNELISIINTISLENKLIIDERFNETDTLGFYGQPYHYFKYWTSLNDTTTFLTLEYNGTFGKRKNTPYDTMIQQINDSINQHFNVLKFKSEESSNKK